MVLLGALVLAGLLGIRQGAPARWLVAGICLLVTVGYLLLVRPSDDREWSTDQARLPAVEQDGDIVRIDGFRRFRYRSPDDYDAHWGEARFDLSQLVGADLGVEQFGPHEAIGHTFAVFRFRDGENLVVSVEIRKEVGESFSALKGLFRQYEKMFVLGDERDLVELRAVHREDTVYLYPLDVPVERVRVFLESLLAETAALHDRPAFYNTATASCSTTLAWHLRAMGEVPLVPRLFLPGYVDGLAHDLGWLGDEPLEALRERHRIDERARAAAGSPDFSEAIRLTR